MEIRFADKKLEIISNDDRIRHKALGKIRSAIYRRRIIALFNAKNLEEVRMLPGSFHELRHNRKGQWACDLDQPYRLIFESIQNPIPIKPDGNYDWTKITGIIILEIVNYHKEK